MDPTVIATFLFGSVALPIFFWLRPSTKVRGSVRNTVGVVGSAALLYSVALFTLAGANAMQWNVSQPMFLAIVAAAGLGIGQLAWMHGREGGAPPSHAANSLAPAPVPPTLAAPAPSISQSTIGAQSPNIVGNPTIIYNAPIPSGPSPEEKKYREQLADEVSVSRKSLDKSRNRWYTASVENRRPDAEKYWKESETRMGESAVLLRKKVSTTAETEFLQIHPGEPVYPNLNRPYMPDGAAINEMWNRVARLTEIEKRVRNGTEPIKYPPPSP
jgi:hypothetical protein